MLFGNSQWTFEAVEGPHFGDVSASNAHSANIDAAYELFGLTVGQSEDTFAPAATVRRDQMATYLIRMLDITVLTDDAAALDQGAAVNELSSAALPDDITGVVEDVVDVVYDVPGVVADADLPVDATDAPDAVTGSPDDGNLLERTLP